MLTGWGFVAPFAVLFGISFLIPIGVSIYSSFFRAAPSGGGLYGGGELVNQFVGLRNYVEIASGSAFWVGMGRVLLFGAVQVPVMIFSALGLALLLDSLMVKRVGGFRLGFFLPYAIPGVVAALIWTYMYNPQFSPINQALGLVGGHVDFFSPNIILWSMANMTTWTFTGYNMLIFLAALQAIPHDLYEAARIDGASEWTIVRTIKVPMVGGATLLAVLLSIIGTVQLFNEPAVLQTVNPWMGYDFTPMMMAYNTMMGSLSPSGDGPASAISILMALIAGVLAVIYAVLQRRVD
ncbi:MAG: sugar ABC transporter permease [Propionibacterium sp.]|nr:sugar ABC transporter permease [Propionibacterium sp.]